MRATRFLLEDGRVVGVACRDGDGEGPETELRAGTVVLASGDFAASEELKARYISPEVAQVDAMNPTATGDGHHMALALGARVINGDVLSGPTLRFVPPPRPLVQAGVIALISRIQPFQGCRSHFHTISRLGVTISTVSTVTPSLRVTVRVTV